MYIGWLAAGRGGRGVGSGRALPLYAYQRVIFDSLKFEKNKIGKTGGKLSEDSVAYRVSSVLVESATIELCSHIKPHVTIFTSEKIVRYSENNI
jgi:hypothetical protein